QQLVSSQQSVTSSDQELQSSEVSLGNALHSEQEAQVALTQARIDAANAITNLNDQVADGALAQQQATLDLQTAKQALETPAAGTTAEGLQQLQLNYAE